jgi:hypothetical protein
VNKQELDAHHERLQVAQAGIAAAEARVEAVSAKERDRPSSATGSTR